MVSAPPALILQHPRSKKSYPVSLKFHPCFPENTPCTTVHTRPPHDPAVPSVHHCSTKARRHDGSSESFHPVAPGTPSRIHRSVDADPPRPHPTAPFPCHPPVVCPDCLRLSGSASRFLYRETPQPRAANTRLVHSCVRSSPRSSLRSPVTSAAFACPPAVVSATAHPGLRRSPSFFANLRIARAGSLARQYWISRSHPTNCAPALCVVGVDRADRAHCLVAQFPTAIAAFPSGCARSKTR